MKTPKEFSSNLNKHIITDQMLAAALYSVNKRAKNYRDQKRRDRQYRVGKKDYYALDEQKEKAMYARKNKLLSILKPSCIHLELTGFERTRVYDYQSGYVQSFFDHGVKDK